MLRLDIGRLLNDRGIEQHHRFLRKLGISAHTASNLLHNQLTYINAVHLEKICLALNCTPNDLFAWKDDGPTTLPPDHAMQKLRAAARRPALIGRIRSLNPEQVEKLNDYLERLQENDE